MFGGGGDPMDASMVEYWAARDSGQHGVHCGAATMPFSFSGGTGAGVVAETVG